MRQRTSTADPVRAGWEAGQLSHKLHAHQLEVYERYRAWEQEPTDDGPGEMRRIFVMDLGRRWGKTFLVLLIKIEDALRNPGSRHTFATAYAKDIADIIIPLADDICEDAPDDCRPVFQQSKQGESQGYYFPNGSSIKLVGVDLHPRALRGRGSEGMAFTEAGYVKNLASTIRRVVYPQFQRRPAARLILESNAPEEIDHDFDAVFIPDAKARGAYVFGTIDDNTALSPEERAEFILAAGGRGAPDCEREYYGVRVRDPERTAVPEFDAQKHVGSVERPEYAITCIGQDPGTRDLFGIVWGYWHYELEKMVIERSWAKRNAGTADIAEVIKQVNAELWGGEQPLVWYDGPVRRENPALHVSDIDLRLAIDLNREHDLHVRQADKSKQNHGVGEAKLYALRDAFKADKILIVPNSGPLEQHVLKAKWNENRTDLERMMPQPGRPDLGHFDCMLALSYLWKALRPWMGRDPRPQDVLRAGEQRVLGPHYVPPQSRTAALSRALQGSRQHVRNPANVLSSNVPLGRCPVCRKHKRLGVWMNGEAVCSEACRDQWMNRNAGKAAR